MEKKIRISVTDQPSGLGSSQRSVILYRDHTHKMDQAEVEMQVDQDYFCNHKVVEADFFLNFSLIHKVRWFKTWIKYGWRLSFFFENSKIFTLSVIFTKKDINNHYFIE